MRLNLDCIRDILIEVESVCDGENELLIEDESTPEGLSQYSPREVRYHILQCEDSGYLKDVRKYNDESMSIVDLSPQGHEMLRLIREETAFNKIKKALIDKGLPFALEAVKSIIIG